MRKDLEKVMGSDQSLYASIEQAMPPMQGNEKVHGAVMQTVARAVSFLHNKLLRTPLQVWTLHYKTLPTLQTLQRLQSS